ncbi:hypothetical protein [Latilactobacillus sakei]|uniref:hypothetical protein n=1 Tax=Latilactobacillus sakei TaxID=1599 RepID=UPI00207364B6|nr:hypothetical protein [Latilactobacillus sakei]
MAYFTEALNFSLRPDKKDYWGLTYEQFLNFMDGIMSQMYSKCLSENIDENDMVIRSPFHCCVASNGEIIVVGLSRDKALRGNTMFSVAKDESGVTADKNGLKTLITEICEREVGYSDNVFMSFHVKTLQNKVLQDSVTNPDVFFTTNFTDEFHKLGEALNTNFDEEKMEAFKDMSAVWKDIDCGAQEFVNNIKKRVNLMDVKPKFKARDIVVKENQAFYVLPFTGGPLNAYEAVKERMVASEEVECNIIKSEDTFDPSRGNNIVENIWQDICTSRFIIADLSEKNPNVFYELGICDTLGKRVISICSNRSRDEDYGGKLPFDIAGDYTIFYDEDYKGIKLLQDQIEQRVGAILNNSIVKTN